MGKDFSLFVYPIETIFAEKLQIAFKKGGQNTRMKDYYDLLKLTEQSLDYEKLKQSIQETFTNRNMEIVKKIDFEESDLARLQTYWGHFLKRDNPPKALEKIANVIFTINAYLDKIYEK